jgi:Zn/Cd-binding protein ZinT
LEEEANKEKSPVKKKKAYVPPAHLYQPSKPIEKKEGNLDEVLGGNQEEDEEKKKQKEMMKKYYRNRYHSFLKALID